MKQVFIVPGYGVPKDIMRDSNMTTYLRAVANYIFDQTAEGTSRPTVILSGGPTDMWKPYQRTEAAEMYRWLKRGIASKDFRKALKRWNVRLESKSLSTLENLLLSSKMIKPGSRVIVFSEFSRRGRWEKILRTKGIPHAKVVPIDFDVSANRYRTEEVKKKERDMIRFDLWALRNTKNFRQHHQFFKKRIEYLRAAGPTNHVQAVRQFWKEGITLLPKEIRTRLQKHV